jgi:hypothetical protein
MTSHKGPVTIEQGNHNGKNVYAFWSGGAWPKNMLFKWITRYHIQCTLDYLFVDYPCMIHSLIYWVFDS